ncbi:MarR-like DNA-binding transcriptional regulator SgrR of sgrS sRNA [Brevibacillus sp. AG162]|uniref:SgrR family transcriptional regulator n=1 Tax=Brevibacillus sp. AG162 TaxID=2572910 RepID=UPI0011534591|nr:SgrR family transcriptional regulator [Brevibacillus sp. AG162]TQK49663.1 MarR-like DNA-binding transcriptional regulator SgrR of sgrS sRNA [Brevibacillus sp. AG162]
MSMDPFLDSTATVYVERVVISMQSAYYYLRLRQHFASAAEGEQQEITLAELARIFCCTIRNVKKVIKQMEEQKWIEWSPGRGRGNVSRIILLYGIEQIVLPIAQERIQDGDLEGAMQLLSDFAITAKGREHFFEWLSGQFGFIQEEIREQKLDTLRMSFYRPIPALDPAFVNRRTESHMVKQLFDTLIRYDEKIDAFIPHLAHHWEVNESRTEWTFYLRKGVFFHHGRELTAHDVVWTLERIADPKTGSPYRWMLQDVEKVTAEKETVVKIVLRRPNQLLLSILASVRLSIVPGDVIQEKGQAFSRLPVGSGPFSLITNDSQMFILEAVPTYFLGRAHLDRVEIWIVPQNNKDVRNEDYFSKRGEVHFQTFWNKLGPMEQWQELQSVEKGCTYLAFNLNCPGPQQDIAFRQALDRLIVREKMIAELRGNRYAPAYGFLPENKDVPGEAAGWDGDFKGCPDHRLYQGQTMQLYTYEGAGNENNAEWLQKHLADCGICVDVTVLPIEELKKPEIIQQADMVVAGEVFDEQWVLGMVEFFKSDVSFSRQLWNPALRERIDQELSALMLEREVTGQRHHLQEVERILREQCAMLFLYHTRQHSAYHSALAGVSLNALGLVDYKNIWFRQ